MLDESAARASRMPSMLALLLGLCLLLPAAASRASIIDTYVGGGNGDGGPAEDALLDPRGMTLVGSASAPDVYVADYINHRIRRIEGATGIIDTVVGTGEGGFAGDGGNALNAKLSFPLDVARDSAGNLYVTDSNNNRVRKVTASGQISTFAGNGTRSYGGDGGLATQAALDSPYGITVGPDGYVYFADHGNNRIRRVGPPGCSASSCIITTVAGTGESNYSGDGGPATSAALRNPADVIFDAAGSMLIADYTNHRVRRVSGGIITTLAGGGFFPSGGVGDGGLAIFAKLRYPTQLSLDSAGHLYIADSQQWRIRMVHATSQIITTVCGTGASGVSGDFGPATEATIHHPWGVAATTAGRFWLSATRSTFTNSLDNRIRAVANGTITPFAGGGLGDGGAAYDAVIAPRGGVAVANADGLPHLYFADGPNQLIRWVDGDSATVFNIGGTGESGYAGDGGPASEARFNNPLDVAVDSGGTVYVADTSNHVVRRITPNGVVTTVAGTGSRGFSGDGGAATQAQLATPSGVAVDGAGRLFIADSNNYRVRMVVNGIISTVAGTGQSASSSDGGAATASSLRYPAAVAVAPSGDVYIADLNDHRVRRIDANGTLRTLAGIAAQSGFSGDSGAATSAKLSAPNTLSVDAAGRVFIADSGNHRIRMVDTAGIIRTVAGNGQATYGGDGGSATAASFDTPSGVAIDPDGQILFIHSANDRRVRLVDLDPGAAQPTATRTPTAVPPTPTRTPTGAHTATRTATPTRTNTPGGVSVALAGRVSYYTGAQGDVPDVRVSLQGPAPTTLETSSRGDYSAVVPLGVWSIEPAKSGGFGMAISSLDAARVLQVVAGLSNFTPQQRIACDTTGDGSLSTLDAVNILRFSAGVIDRLPVAHGCGSDWAFYPSPATVPNQTLIVPAIGAGGCQMGSILLNPLVGAATNQHFDAILFGDCTGNWTAGAAALQRTRGARTVVHAGPQRSGRGGRVRLPIYVQSATPFQALDLRLRFDADAGHFVSARAVGAAAGAMVSQQSSDGTLTLALASGDPVRGSRGAVLFLEFQVDRDASLGAELIGALVDEQVAPTATRRSRS